ncbi:MAG: triphosphoribosyl-dephospho-CoA synthase [Terrimicrobiaceae bacterium]
MSVIDQVCEKVLLPTTLADHAVSALISELELYPKPGLVSPVDSGSHADMDHTLLRASANSLRPFFQDLARHGEAGASFESGLVPAGIRAEQQMMQITQGINTHRGAIFSMGLLVAATASLKKLPATAHEISEALLSRWGSSLQAHAEDGRHASTHGGGVFRHDGVGGARQEAALGFPSIFQLALPHFTGLAGENTSFPEAGVETLFLLMSSVPDTNVIHRGGREGATFVMQRAADFLHQGGIKNPLWHEVACQIHREFMAKNLSPGGSADLLAGTFFVARMLTDFAHYHECSGENLQNNNMAAQEMAAFGQETRSDFL